jgi:hypothetical protein
MQGTSQLSWHQGEYISLKTKRRKSSFNFEGNAYCTEKQPAGQALTGYADAALESSMVRIRQGNRLRAGKLHQPNGI